ncbi:hypothetical protein SAMN05444746_13059 [Variovorax sp. OK212]|nr:hypothetical protein SAMN05518853_13159 [Variovorax sp. OK202]SFE62508.1 hypothetical protein SAMN05444746_13059 [Variovorax sp. OK212]
MRASDHPGRGTLTAWVREAVAEARRAVVGSVGRRRYSGTLMQAGVMEPCTREESAQRCSRQVRRVPANAVQLEEPALGRKAPASMKSTNQSPPSQERDARLSRCAAAKSIQRLTISSTATSKPRSPTRNGSRTSRSSRSRLASCTSRSSSTASMEWSSVGPSGPVRTLSWSTRCWMQPSRQWPKLLAGLGLTPVGASAEPWTCGMKPSKFLSAPPPRRPLCLELAEARRVVLWRSDRLGRSTSVDAGPVCIGRQHRVGPGAAVTRARPHPAPNAILSSSATYECKATRLSLRPTAMRRRTTLFKPRGSALRPHAAGGHCSSKPKVRRRPSRGAAYPEKTRASLPFARARHRFFLASGRPAHRSLTQRGIRLQFQTLSESRGISNRVLL